MPFYTPKPPPPIHPAYARPEPAFVRQEARDNFESLFSPATPAVPAEPTPAPAAAPTPAAEVEPAPVMGMGKARRRGRPKLYRSNAEKQQAYQQRKKKRQTEAEAATARQKLIDDILKKAPSYDGQRGRMHGEGSGGWGSAELEAASARADRDNEEVNSRSDSTWGGRQVQATPTMDDYDQK